MALVRLKLVRLLEPILLKDPTTGAYDCPSMDKPYRSDHPLVRAYPWAFSSDEDATLVEDASAAPGERRALRKPLEG